MKLRVRLVVAFLLIAAIAIDKTAYGQVTTGAIHGTVTDPAGAVVPNVDITVLNTSNGIAVTAKSDGSGYFQRHSSADRWSVHDFSCFSRILKVHRERNSAQRE